MPSKYEFQQLIEKIEEAINLYKNSPCRFNENKIFLSNGKAINFEIKPHNVPHLLGININNLKNSKFLKETKPLDMVEELINRYNTFYERMIRGEIIFGDIFSDFWFNQSRAVKRNFFRYFKEDCQCFCSSY